jgi:hypothetical protein
VQRLQLVVEQVFVFGSGLVGRYDGELGQLQLPERYGQARHQLVLHRLRGRRVVAQRLKQAGLNLVEELPAIGITTAEDLALRSP